MPTNDSAPRTPDVPALIPTVLDRDAGRRCSARSEAKRDASRTSDRGIRRESPDWTKDAREAFFLVTGFRFMELLP